MTIPRTGETAARRPGAPFGGVCARGALILLGCVTTLGTTDSAAQKPSRSLGVLLTQSVASAGAAHGSVCPCTGRTDVLEPVSVTTLELELTLPLRIESGWGLEYPIRALPLALARNNPIEPARMIGSGRWSMSVDTHRAATVGFGLKPVGLRGWAGSGRVRVEGAVSAGIIHFTTPLLASNATRFNFAYEFSIGIGIAWPGAGRAAVGYRRHHLSNAGLGEVNPGLDSHAAYLGFWLD